MMVTQVNKDSKNIMHLIQANTRGAEIGVWYGNTSINFYNKKVEHLDLVDPWSIEAYRGTTEFEWEEYLSRYKEVTGSDTPEDFQKYYDSVYTKVKDRFSMYYNVKIHRKTSDEYFDNFTGEKLDWIYLDGSHAYAEVLRDLENSLNVLKPGGIILGDDYKWGNGWGKPQVTQAVDEFVEKHSFKLNQHGFVQFEIRI